jgi:hypothetical protein
VAHTYNPRYLGGRDRKIAVQRQPRQIVLTNLSRKTLSQKIGLVEWLKVKTLSSNPSAAIEKKNLLMYLFRCNHLSGFF